MSSIPTLEHRHQYTRSEMSIEIQARAQWGGGLDFPHLLCSPVVFSQLYLDLSSEPSLLLLLLQLGRVNPAENCGESHYLCRELRAMRERSATPRCMFNACSVCVCVCAWRKNTGQPEHHLKHHFIDLQNSAPEN